MDSIKVVVNFLDCINRHNADELAAMMTEDHLFIDSLGNAVHGRENMRTGWRNYYGFCPDYWVSHEEIFADGRRVAVFGAAGGTIQVNGGSPPENKWRTPAAWLAIGEKGLLKVWRVYADNKPVYDILARPKQIPGG